MGEVLVSIVFKPGEKTLQHVKLLRDILLSSFGMSTTDVLFDLEIKAYDLTIKEDSIADIRVGLSEFMRYEFAQYVYFDSFAITKADGEFSFMPSSQSRGYLLEKIRKLYAEFSSLGTDAIRYEPALSLAERLPIDRLTEINAIKELEVIDFDFFCDHSYFKLTDPSTGLLREVAEYKFGNEKQFGLEHGQFKLF